MAGQTLAHPLLDKWSISIISVVACLVVYLMRLVWANKPLANFPLVGEELGGSKRRRLAYLSNCAELYKAGYHRVCTAFLCARLVTNSAQSSRMVSSSSRLCQVLKSTKQYFPKHLYYRLTDVFVYRNSCLGNPIQVP